MMFEIKSIVKLEKLKGRQITDFLINCDDEKYQNWWPGTHLGCHSLNKTVNPTLVKCCIKDEYVEHSRIKMKGLVQNYILGKLI